MIEFLKEIGETVKNNVTLANVFGAGGFATVLVQAFIYSRLRKKGSKVAEADSIAVEAVAVVDDKVNKLDTENKELKNELSLMKTQNQFMLNMLAKGFLSSNLTATVKEEIALMYGKANDLVTQSKTKVEELKRDANEVANVIKAKYEEIKDIVVPKTESMLDKLKREATLNETSKIKEV